MSALASESRAARRTLIVAIVLSFLGPLVASWSYFPAQDEPNHLFTFHALQELRQPHSWLHHFFFSRLAGHVTYIAVERLVLGLASFLPLAVADRVMIMLIIVALPLSILYFLRRVNPDAPAYLLAAPLLGCNWMLHMGFWNQLYGYVLLFVALGYVLPRIDRLRYRDLPLFAALLTVATVIHPLVLLFAVGVAGLCALIAPPPGARLRTLGRVLLAALPGLAIFASAAIADLSQSQMAPVGYPVLSIAWETIPRRFCYFFIHVFFSPRPWAIAVQILLFAALFLGGVAAFVARSARRDEGGVILRFTRRDMLLAAAGATYLAYLLAPEAIGQPLSLIPERLPLLIVVFILGWMPAPSVRLGRRIATGLSLAGLFLLVENVAYVRQWNRVLRGYTAGESRVSPGAKLLPVFFDTVGAVRSAAFPMVQAWAYYAVARDAVAPYSFAYQPHTAIGFRRAAYLAELPNPGEYFAEQREKNGLFVDEWRPDVPLDQSRELAYQAILDDGRRYDYLLAWRPPNRFREVARAEGFTASYAAGQTLLLLPPGKSDPPPVPGAELTSPIPWEL